MANHASRSAKMIGGSTSPKKSSDDLGTSVSRLEWMVVNEEVVGEELADEARRTLVRIYMATTPRPGLAKTTS